jgi:hypothetical protein
LGVTGVTAAFLRIVETCISAAGNAVNRNILIRDVAAVVKTATCRFEPPLPSANSNI